MLFSIVMQTAASIKPAANVYALSPRNADPAPTVDGVLESTWGTHNSSVMPIQIGGESQSLRVYTCVFNDFIYFGLQLRISTHSANESLAIACTNAGPSSLPVTDTVFNYSVAKIVRIDGMSRDWKIYPTYFSNWTPPTPGKPETANSILLKVGFVGASNFSFYEMRLGRVLPRATDGGGDLNWTRKQTFAIKFYYGTLYGNGSERDTPQIESWTPVAQKVTLTIPAAPDDPTSPEIKALELNMLIGKGVLFVASALCLAAVGIFIVRTKARIRRI